MTMMRFGVSGSDILLMVAAQMVSQVVINKQMG